MHLLIQKNFKPIINRYDGDRYVKRMSCIQQLTTLFYVQIKDLFSLRDIQTNLRAQADKWHHVGLETVAKSTLADANRDRPYQIWGEMFMHSMNTARNLPPVISLRLKCLYSRLIRPQ